MSAYHQSHVRNRQLWGNASEADADENGHIPVTVGTGLRQTLTATENRLAVDTLVIATRAFVEGLSYLLAGSGLKKEGNTLSVLAGAGGAGGMTLDELNEYVNNHMTEYVNQYVNQYVDNAITNNNTTVVQWTAEAPLQKVEQLLKLLWDTSLKATAAGLGVNPDWVKAPLKVSPDAMVNDAQGVPQLVPAHLGLETVAPFTVNKDTGQLGMALHKSLLVKDNELKVNQTDILKGFGAIYFTNGGITFLDSLGIDLGQWFDVPDVEALNELFGDVEVRIARIRTAPELSQKNSTLSIVSLGYQQIPVFSAFSGFISDPTFKYSETLHELKVDRILVSTTAATSIMEDGRVIWLKYLRDYFAAKTDGGIKIGPEAQNKRELEVLVDNKSIKLATSGLFVNVGTSSKTALAITDAGLSVAKDALVDNKSIEVAGPDNKLQVRVGTTTKTALAITDEGLAVAKDALVDNKSLEVGGGADDKLQVRVGTSSKTCLAITDEGLSVTKDALIDNVTLGLTSNDKIEVTLAGEGGITVDKAAAKIKLDVSQIVDGQTIKASAGKIAGGYTAGQGISISGSTISANKSEDLDDSPDAETPPNSTNVPNPVPNMPPMPVSMDGLTGPLGQAMGQWTNGQMLAGAAAAAGIGGAIGGLFGAIFGSIFGGGNNPKHVDAQTGQPVGSDMVVTAVDSEGNARIYSDHKADGTEPTELMNFGATALLFQAKNRLLGQIGDWDVLRPREEGPYLVRLKMRAEPPPPPPGTVVVVDPNVPDTRPVMCDMELVPVPDLSVYQPLNRLLTLLSSVEAVTLAEGETYVMRFEPGADGKVVIGSSPSSQYASPQDVELAKAATLEETDDRYMVKRVQLQLLADDLDPQGFPSGVVLGRTGTGWKFSTYAELKTFLGTWDYATQITGKPTIETILAGTGLTKTGSTLSVNAAQSGITSLGTLTGLTAAGNIITTGYRRWTMSGGNSTGHLYGAWNQLGDGVNWGYNAYNDNTLWTVPAAGGATSRIRCGYGFVSVLTGVAGQPPTDVHLTIMSGTGSSFTTAVSMAEVLTLTKNAVAATAPTLGTHLTNKTYVDGRTWNYATQLTNKPTLGLLAAKDAVDYATTDVINKPTLGLLAAKDTVDYATDVINKPTLGLLAAKDTVDYATDVINKPAAAETILAGTGLTKTGSTLSVNADQTQVTTVGTLTSVATTGNVVSNTAGTGNVYTGQLWTPSMAVGGYNGLQMGVATTVRNSAVVGFVNAGGSGATSNNMFLGLVGASKVRINGSGDVTLESTTASTTTGTGALIIPGTGGAGIGGNANVGGILSTNTGSGGTIHYFLKNGGAARWGMGLTGAEGGTASGSQFALWCYNNDGTNGTVFSPLQIRRSDGVTQLSGLTVTDNVTTVAAAPTLGTHLANKTYVDAQVSAGVVAGTGLTKTGTTLSVNASQTQITTVGTLTGLTVGGAGLLKMATSNTDYTLVGTTATEDVNDTRIVVSGSAKTTNPGYIQYYSTTANGQHQFWNNNVETLRLHGTGALCWTDFNVDRTLDGASINRIRNRSNTANAHVYLAALNNTEGGLALFLNSSSRTADGGVNGGTLRNDIGPLRLMCNGTAAVTLSGGTATLAGNVLATGAFRQNCDAWITSADGKNRVYYATNGRTYYGSANGHEFRNASDGYMAAFTTYLFENAGVISCWGYKCKQGTGVPAGTIDVSTGNIFNTWWDGTQLLSYVDNTYIGVFYILQSDYRLKTNLVPLRDGAIQRIHALKPVTYEHREYLCFKRDGKRKMGFIAHELEEIIPEAVTGKKDAVDEKGNPMLQSVDPMPVVATLVKAFQELSARVETLESLLAKALDKLATKT